MSEIPANSPISIWKRLRNQEITCDEAIQLLVDKRGGVRIELLDEEVSYRFFHRFEDRKSLPPVIPLLLWHGYFYLGSPRELTHEEIKQLSNGTLTGIKNVLVSSDSYLLWFLRQNLPEPSTIAPPIINPLTGVNDEAHLDEISNMYLSQALDQTHRINALISVALQHRASDIHLEPTEAGLRVRYRIDGILRTTRVLPPEVSRKTIVALKVMSKMNISESRRPQDGRISQHYITADNLDLDLDMRVSTFPCLDGEKAVIRLLMRNQMIATRLQDLGFSERSLNIYRNWLTQPQGLIIVTGPTGSGKTSTLYASLQFLATDQVNIVTMEDPVEYTLPNITQGQVQETGGLTFAAGLKAILRQDPDIIMVGEIRDLETAEITIRSAMTGHLVLSTMHTNDAIGAIARLHDLGLHPSLIGESLLGVVAQRLVRKVCSFCSEPYIPTQAELDLLNLTMEDVKTQDWRRGKGCEHCFGSGHLGREAIFELLNITPQVRKIINRGVQSQLTDYWIDQSYESFSNSVREKICAGITTTEEALRVLPRQMFVNVNMPSELSKKLI
ncbi:type II secretory pathway, ATPase PulE/Tfp pilus assembly pathway, ATPase PilB [Synechococcus sp. PCC 7502]|uniref:GspE/PulE family protein n=1 Tax=Synechococcus sp. PCC 7502 TaxID=1173263 RepID=UPI00029FB434|nr:GspE/PulE family protein [Synechococcus sp. PCC 7502]AFY72991.1 type II secretory pathway, ATPase PulE/Tfp pilus assembly pathway, ATPase PilB [Synechococcus sp. PCC 7502]